MIKKANDHVYADRFLIEEFVIQNVKNKNYMCVNTILYSHL